jgi:5'(3')-deoxyribonucleotidase
MKKIIYIDMDGTVVDFKSGIDELTEIERKQYEGNEDDHPEIFSKMKPVSGAIDTISKLNTKYDLYLLSTAPWDNPNAWKHKREWVGKYFGNEEGSIFWKRLILSHHKNLNKGAYLIDDNPDRNGADKFQGKLIHFASEEYPDWESIENYFLTTVKE